MLRLTSKHKAILTLSVLFTTTIISFQNCSRNFTFESVDAGKKLNLGEVPDDETPIVDQPPIVDGPPVEICEGISCDLTPLTNKPAVTTILLALGDEADDQLVVKGASAQLLAESVIRYTSPKEKPKVLLVRDQNWHGESPTDFAYTENVLLARYDVTAIDEPDRGLTAAMLDGYDVVWLNNPGHPMGSVHTRDALIAFKGGVVVQGDDMSSGAGFDTSPLTGLRFVDNGASISCGGMTYRTDNNLGVQFNVSLNPAHIPGADASTIGFVYGNDIDNTVAARTDLQILAVARGNISTCTQDRPTIVRYLK